ncbi:MAG: hexokinase [Candidatus Omnitrophota bacterium]|nr:MAG: hexokinase [Candidatus Omnitrophota bacterium]
MPDNKRLKNIADAFDVSRQDIGRIIRDFHSEMRKGLSRRKSSLKMLPAYVKKPKGTERGEFLALDLGGTNFRVLALRLKGKRRISVLGSKKFILKKKHITGTGKTLFDFIAGCIKTFMDEYKIDTGQKHNIGFTFSFPMKKRRISSGILLRWTKGFKAGAVEGKDVVELLNESLERKGLHNTKVVAIANDTVSTLVAKSYEDKTCDVGVILGTGTNACYPEKQMIINIEWGNFNKIRLTPYDRTLNHLSQNPGEQILEKMISGMYLGVLTRLVARDLIREAIPEAFKAEHMSIVEADTSKNLSHTDKLLKKFRIRDSKYSDRKLLKKICAIISTRAARLSALAIASVVTKIDPRLSGKHTIAVDGSVYEKYTGFSRRIKATLKEIFGNKKAANIRLSLTKDASAKGAAIIAAAVGARSF